MSSSLCARSAASGGVSAARRGGSRPGRNVGPSLALPAAAVLLLLLPLAAGVALEPPGAYSSLKWMLPRQAFDGTAVANDEFDLTNGDYLEALIILALPGVVIALLCALFALCFCAGRVCCNSCGSPEARPKGYTRGQANCVRVVLVIVFAVVVPCCVVELLANGQVTSTLDDSVESFVDASTDVQLQSILFGTNLTSVAVNLTREAEVDAMIDRSRSLTLTSGDWRNEVLGYDNYRSMVIMLIALSTAAIGLVALVAAIGSIHWLSFSSAAMSMMILPVIWIVFSIHLAAGSALEDACFSIERVLSDSQRDETVPIDPTSGVTLATFGLSEAIECVEQGYQTGVSDIQMDAFQVSIDQLNAYLDEGNYRNVDFAAYDLLSVPAIEAAEDEMERLGAVLDDDPNLSSAILLTRYEYARCERYLVLQRMMYDLSSCTILAEALAGSRELICTTAKDSVDVIGFVTLIIGLHLIITLRWLVAGKKRLDAINRRDPLMDPPPPDGRAKGDAALLAVGAGGAAATTAVVATSPGTPAKPQDSAANGRNAVELTPVSTFRRKERPASPGSASDEPTKLAAPKPLPPLTPRAGQPGDAAESSGKSDAAGKSGENPRALPTLESRAPEKKKSSGGGGWDDM